MDKRIKRLLILVFAIIFLIGGPLAIFYSRGYRFDFETKKIVKSGAFYFRTQPESCEIYLDGKLKKKTDFLFGNAFVKNLLPKKYNIRIEKEGYFPWEKTLEVKEEFVTEAKNIILFSKNLNFSLSLSDIEDYFFSPDKKKIILEKTNKEGWTLEILDLEKNTQELFLEEKGLTKKESQFRNLNWNSDSRMVLIETEIEEDTKYFIVNLLEEKQIFPLGYGDIQEISFNPNNSQEIFFLKSLNGSKSLFQANFLTQELPKVILKSLITYKISDGNIFWLSPDGFLYRSDFSGKRLGVLNTESFSIKEGLKYKVEIFSPAVFLRENNALYQLNSSSRIFEKFSESIKNLKLSPDSKKLVIGNNYEIWILFLIDIDEQSQKKASQKIFLTRFSQKIGEIFWLNPDYLMFNTGNKLKIAEIDDRDRINIIELGEFENPKIFWNQELERIYVLSNKELYSLGNLLP